MSDTRDIPGQLLLPDHSDEADELDRITARIVSRHRDEEHTPQAIGQVLRVVRTLKE